MSNRGFDKDPFEELLRQYGGERREPAPDDEPTPLRPGQRRGAPPPPQVSFRLPGGCLTLIGVFLFLFIFGPVLLDMAVDWQWFGSLGFASIYGTILSTRGLVFLVAGLLAALLLGINWAIALRVAAPGKVFRGQQVAMPPGTLRSIAIGAGALVSLIMALAASGAWSTILQFFQHASFGVADPLFNEDIGFYVFELPFYDFIRGWLLGVVVVAALGAGAIYATRLELFGSREGLRVDRRVLSHLAILGAVFLGLISWGYWLSRYELLFSEHERLYGASYTDVHARLLAFQILMFVAAISALLLLISIRVRTLTLLGAAFGFWVLAMVLVGGVYPGIVQNFQVTPNEPSLESPYIKHNIDATRAAFGLDKFRERPFEVAVNLQPADVEANRDVVDNVRLWDYRPLLTTFNQLQALRGYYQFNPLDIDRYTLANGEQQVMLGARELNIAGLPEAASWVNQHLVFTHGYGVSAILANVIEGAGQPRFIVRNVPVEYDDPALRIDEPRIYYGEMPDNYVFVRTNVAEFDYPGQAGEVRTEYRGTGGVQIGTFLNKLLFATYLGDFTVLISDQILDESRVLFRRNFREAVRMVAPFLYYDADPYIVIADGKLYWIQDAYTVTDRYPYARPADQGFNYMRNSVKVVVDAYNGSMDFYIMDDPAVPDDDDPLARTYQRIFPDLFKDDEAMPASIRAHLRYPETMFNIQAQVYEQFHVTDPQVFYNRDDVWRVPFGGGGAGSLALQAYYTQMKLPGEAENQYVLMMPFTPAAKPNMIAWMAGNSDYPGYGTMDVIRFPANTAAYGPAQIEATINQDTRISQQITLWSQAGSEVIFGNLLVLPLGRSVLYVQPLFLQASQNAIPELKQVVAASSGRAGMGDDLDSALRAMFAQRGAGSQPPPISPTPGPGTPQPTPAARTPVPGTDCSGDAATFAQSALEHYQRSQEALRAGDWATYGAEQEAMSQDLTCLAQVAR